MHLSIGGRKPEGGGLYRGDTFKGNAAFSYPVGRLMSLAGYPLQTPHCLNASSVEVYRHENIVVQRPPSVNDSDDCLELIADGYTTM